MRHRNWTKERDACRIPAWLVKWHMHTVTRFCAWFSTVILQTVQSDRLSARRFDDRRRWPDPAAASRARITPFSGKSCERRRAGWRMLSLQRSKPAILQPWLSDCRHRGRRLPYMGHVVWAHKCRPVHLQPAGVSPQAAGQRQCYTGSVRVAHVRDIRATRREPPEHRSLYARTLGYD